MGQDHEIDRINKMKILSIPVILSDLPSLSRAGR